MASTTFLLDDSGDLGLSGGHLGLLSDADAVVQNVRVRVRFFLSEWFLDESIGVPWLQRILQKGTPAAEVREHLRAAIASAPDITEVTGSDLVLNRASRVGSVSYQAATIYGSSASGEVTV